MLIGRTRWGIPAGRVLAFFSGRDRHWWLCLGLVVAGSILPARLILILFGIFLARFSYPIDLEWCEGISLYQAHRLLNGLYIYGAQDAAFRPLPYPPFHTVAIALFGLFGLDYESGRAVSILAFVVFCAAVAIEVGRRLRWSMEFWGLALGTTALVAAAFPTVGGWYDLVRVDSLALALVAAAAVVVSARERGLKHLVSAAVLSTLAVYTKQTGALFVGWLGLWLLVERPRHALFFAGLTASLSLAWLGVLQWATSGHFWEWIFSNLRGHPVQDEQLAFGLRKVVDFAPFVVAIPVVALVGAQRGWLGRRTILWLGLLLASVPASLGPFMKRGGFVNNLMPMLWMAAPAAVLLAIDGAPSKRLRRGYLLLVLAAINLFVLARPIETQDFIPTAEMWTQARNFNRLVESLEGGVLIYDLPFTPIRAGHDTKQWHPMPFLDQGWAGARRIAFGPSIKAANARWVITPQGDAFQAQFTKRGYRAVATLPKDHQVRMLTGDPHHLSQLWERARR